MLNAVLSLLGIFAIVMLAEYLRRVLKLTNEKSRQLVHISAGTFVAFWPFYMSYLSIGICSIILFIVVFAGRYERYIASIKWPAYFPFNLGTKLLKFVDSLHTIRRLSWGVLIFPLGIGFLALFEPSRYVFLIAMLNVGLADGLASYIGSDYGKSMRYKIFEQDKSVVGSLTFLIVSFLIVLLVKLIDPEAAVISWFTVIYLPIILTFVENFAVFGTDDFMIPLVALVVLEWFHS